MNKMYRNSIEEFAGFVAGFTHYKILDNEFYEAAIIGSYDSLQDIIRVFIESGKRLIYADFGDPEWNDYDGEYVLEVDKDHIAIEKTRYEDSGRHIRIEADDIFVLPDVNYDSGLLIPSENGIAYSVVFRDDVEENLRDNIKSLLKIAGWSL